MGFMQNINDNLATITSESQKVLFYILIVLETLLCYMLADNEFGIME